MFCFNQDFLNEWLIICLGQNINKMSLTQLVPVIKEAVKNQWVMSKGLRSQKEVLIGILWDHLSNEKNYN